MTLDELYASLPKIECRQLCGATACGPIQFSPAEEARITRYLGWKVNPKTTADNSCPMLKHCLCRIYPVRPLICRLWGCVPMLRCPHGCEPDRWLTNDEGFELLIYLGDLRTMRWVGWGRQSSVEGAIAFAKRNGVTPSMLDKARSKLLVEWDP